MAVRHIFVALQAKAADGSGVVQSDLVNVISIDDDDDIVISGSDEEVLVEFAPICFSDRGFETMFARLDQTFNEVAAFLNRQDVSVFQSFHENGLRLCIYIELHITDDLMECRLPVHLLAACERLRLPIQIISDDRFADHDDT